MRVLTLTNLYPNPFQPHRASFNRVQLRLLGDRHPVRVIAPIAWTDELAGRRQGQPGLPRGRRVVLDGLEVEHPRYFFPPRAFRGTYGRAYRASVRRAFDRAVGEFRPEVLYAPWAYPDGWAAVGLGRGAGLPVVLKVHGSDILLLDRHPSRRGPTAEALRGADAVVAVSEDLARKVVGLGADPCKVRVIYDGVDKAKFRPGARREARCRLGLDPEVPLVLSVGNLVPVKRQDVLVDACALLQKAGVRFHCRVIGRGPLRESLDRRASGLGLGDQFATLGAFPQDDLPDWYRAASAFALPSDSEGVPNVLLEAAACGAPFVASRVGGIPEIEGIGPSRLVPPNDPEALASALTRFIEADGRPPSGPDSARDVSETVDELERLFQDIIEGRTPGRAPAPAFEEARR